MTNRWREQDCAWCILGHRKVLSVNKQLYQARKVGRLVRHVDLWSLLKVALLFYTCLAMAGVVPALVCFHSTSTPSAARWGGSRPG